MLTDIQKRANADGYFKRYFTNNNYFMTISLI